jgi:hypothetical protein
MISLRAVSCEVDESRLVLFEGCTAFPLPLCYLIHNSLDTLSIRYY